MLSLDLVELMISGNDAHHRIALAIYQRDGLAGARSRDIEECCQLVNGVDIGGVQELQLMIVGLRAVGDGDERGGRFLIGSVAAFAVDQRCLARLRKGHELDGTRASDLAGIRIHRHCLDAAAVAHAGVGVIHLVVGALHALDVCVEGVGILHDELAATHKAKARTKLVAELVLDLIEVHRQLFVAAKLPLYQIGDGLLVGRT